MTASAGAGGAEPLIPKSEFVGLDGVAHLCTGGEAPWLHSHQRALERFGRHKSGGMAGRDELFAVYASAKTRAARLLGIEPARVAFLAHASEGLNLAVRAVDWRPGDNAVVADVEYPSLVYPIAALRDRGVAARVVRAERGYLSMDALAGAVDLRTRLLLVSHVSYLTGQRLDLARCAQLARSRGAFLAVDATHALGVAPVDGELCDFVVSACYKWLLATHGVGIFAWNRERVGDPAPATLGWHSVSHRGGTEEPLSMPLRPDGGRFEAGNPSLIGCAVLDNALERLERLHPDSVLAHALDLGAAIREGLVARGIEPLTPAAADERAGNVCFPAEQAPDLARALAEKGVLVWGGDGRVRVSAHCYNDRADVVRFLAALDAVG